DALSAGGEDQLSLVVYGEEWSTGVIGLVAGRLLERYKRPVVVLAKEGGVIKGSVRSVEGVDAVQLLQAGDVYLEKYGGHSRAAGLTFLTSTTDQVGRFRDDLNRWMVEQGWQLGALAEATSRKPDMELPLDAVEIGLAEKIGELEPFGIGFPAPLFSARCRLALIRRVGSTGQHLACVLEQNRQRKKAIGFGMGDLPAEEKEYEVHFTVRKEEWNGQPEISCHIERIVL
ncbi:hypothetical protein KGQ71_04635, partial [Patescibacteria group bacterium]|nr:hypothetical protein [Patescibacteria group bacterium]